MLYNYSEYVKENLIVEGSSSTPEFIYWERQLEDVFNDDWSEISVKKHYDNTYKITFKTGTNQYDYYGIIFKKGLGTDVYYVEKPEVAKKFTEKFFHEFWEKPQVYIKELGYTPKCLGDVSHVRDAEKYNM